MFPWAVFLLSAFAPGDTLALKDGRVISGTYLDGTTTAIRFLSADRVETIPIHDIQRVSFDPGASTATIPTDGVAASTVPDVANKQQLFCDAGDSFRKGDPFDWEDRTSALMGTSGRFDTWRGTVRFQVEKQWVILSFVRDCQGVAQATEFSSASHDRTGSDGRTLIPLNSPLACELTKVNGNALVVVSGHLVYVADQDRTQSHSDPGTADNPAASVASPRYLVPFDGFELAQ
jgi:hypothetical protein